MKGYYFITAFKKAVVILLGLASSSLLARYLGVEDRGTYALIATWAAVIVVVFNFGLNYSYQKEKAKSGNQKTLIFVCIALCISTFLALSYCLSGWAIGWKQFAPLALLIAAFSLLRMQLAFMALLENFYKASFVNILQAMLEVSLLIYAFFHLKSEPFYAVVIICGKEILGVFFNLVLLIPSMQKSKGVTGLDNRIGLGDIKDNYFFTILNIIFLKFVILAYSFTGASQKSIGLLAIAVVLSEYFWLFSDISKDVLTKVTTENSGIEKILKSVRLTMSVCVAALVGYLILGYWIVEFLYGHEFVEAFRVSLILLVGVIGLVPYKLLSIKNISDGATSESNKASIIGFAIVAPLAWLLMNNYGLYGAAISGATLYITIGLLVSLRFSSRNKVPLHRIYIPAKEDFFGGVKSGD